MISYIQPAHTAFGITETQFSSVIKTEAVKLVASGKTATNSQGLKGVRIRLLSGQLCNS